MGTGYLILNISPPIVSGLDGIDSNIVEKQVSEQINIKLIRKDTYTESKEHPHLRYYFWFPNYKRDDQRATQIGEALFYCVNVFHGPFGDKDEYAFVFPLPKSLLKKDSISLYDLYEIEDNRASEDKILRKPKWTLGSTIRVISQVMIASWKIVPLLLENEYLFNAFRFMKESQDTFYVLPVDHHEVLEDPDNHFVTGWDKSKAEHALMNTYKVIEALIGEPPTDDSKLKDKIRNLGIDPEMKFGINSDIPLFEFVRKINKARDKKAAHGRTPPSKILVRDLFLYQDCALFILKTTIEHLIGEDIYSS